MHARALHVATVFSRRLAPRAATASRASTKAPLLLSKSFRASTKTMAGASPDADLCGEVFFLDEFAMRQWDDPKYGGTQIKGFDKAEFVRRVHEAHADGAGLVDGYAPFCKHVFVPNFIPGTKVGSIPITPENEKHLRSGYSARSDAELAVLTRWFPADKVELPEAAFLDVILYSREQIRIENAAMGEDSGSDAPWGIVSVKAQDVDSELPMQPITMMRNALGADEGGSGVALDAAKYRESVAYWAGHAPIQ